MPVWPTNINFKTHDIRSLFDTFSNNNNKCMWNLGHFFTNLPRDLERVPTRKSCQTETLCVKSIVIGRLGKGGGEGLNIYILLKLDPNWTIRSSMRNATCLSCVSKFIGRIVHVGMLMMIITVIYNHIIILSFLTHI